MPRMPRPSRTGAALTPAVGHHGVARSVPLGPGGLRALISLLLLLLLLLRGCLPTAQLSLGLGQTKAIRSTESPLSLYPCGRKGTDIIRSIYLDN